MSGVTKAKSTLDENLAKLSFLDIDDLMILSLMLEGLSNVQICAKLRLTPPAMSHRLNKYLKIYGSDFLVTGNKNSYMPKRILSEKGIEFAKKARKALCSFLGVDDKSLFVDAKL